MNTATCFVSVNALMAMLAVGSPVRADVLHPIEAMQADLGSVYVTAYYMPTERGYQVVATVQDTAELPTMVARFVTTLQPDQDATISVPRPIGQRSLELVFRRTGDTVIVVRPAAAVD
jgi:hypothetical protein